MSDEPKPKRPMSDKQRAALAAGRAEQAAKAKARIATRKGADMTGRAKPPAPDDAPGAPKVVDTPYSPPKHRKKTDPPADRPADSTGTGRKVQAKDAPAPVKSPVTTGASTGGRSALAKFIDALKVAGGLDG